MSADAFLVRAPRFAVALAACECWSCVQRTRVGRLVIGPQAPDDDDASGAADEDPSELTYIQSLNADALAAVLQVAPWMRWLGSNSTGTTYFGNGCEHCGVLQGEHFLGEPGGPYFPLSNEEAKAISMTWVETLLEAAVGGLSMGVVWLRTAPVRKPRKPRKRSSN